MAYVEFVNVYLFFDLSNGFTAEVKAALDGEVERAKAVEECLWFGYTVTEDSKRALIRNGFKDAEGLLKYVSGNTIKANMEGLKGTLSSVSIHGPKSEVLKLKEGGVADEAFGTVNYHDTFNVISAMKDCEVKPSLDSAIVLAFFELRDGLTKEMKKDLAVFVDATKLNETKNLFYGFTYCEETKQVHCRESYTDAQGIREHFKNVGESLGAFGNREDVNVLYLEIHGSKEDVESLREETKEMVTGYAIEQNGFSRVSV